MKKREINWWNSDKGIFTFLRSQIGAGLGSIAFHGSSFLLQTFANVYYVYANMIGSTLGGITDCIFDFQWTFKTAKEVKKWQIATKYAIVWCMSMALNARGTYLLKERLEETSLVRMTKATLFEGKIPFIAELIVALFIGIFWNYFWKKYFVYRNLPIKRWWQTLLLWWELRKFK